MTAAAQPLTNRQRDIYAFITGYAAANAGKPPTMQEMADQFGTSKTTIFEHVRALKAKGWITNTPHKERSIIAAGCCPACGRAMEESKGGE
jgi:SOS-response transcriptional repressor LexA